MDPKQTLIELLESIAARDINEARNMLDYLDEWLAKGGAMPESIHKALEALRFAD